MRSILSCIPWPTPSERSSKGGHCAGATTDSQRRRSQGCRATLQAKPHLGATDLKAHGFQRKMRVVASKSGLHQKLREVLAHEPSWTTAPTTPGIAALGVDVLGILRGPHCFSASAAMKHHTKVHFLIVCGLNGRPRLRPISTPERSRPHALRFAAPGSLFSLCAGLFSPSERPAMLAPHPRGPLTNRV